MKTKLSPVLSLFAGAAFLAATVIGLISTPGCELAVRLDIGLVDSGDTPCTVCLDDAETVILDDAGNPEIVPKEDSDASADAAPAVDAAIANGATGSMGTPTGADASLDGAR